nr:hypothetical protein [Tanacetum cinerariifolium]
MELKVVKRNGQAGLVEATKKIVKESNVTVTGSLICQVAFFRFSLGRRGYTAHKRIRRMLAQVIYIISLLTTTFMWFQVG